MLKEELRLNYLNLRQRLTETQINSGSEKLAEHCLRLPIWELNRFHTFIPIPGKKEVDTAPLCRLLRSRHKEIVVPKMAANRELKHYLLEADTRLVINNWGIPEPAEAREVLPESVDVVFVPLLAYDRKGYRVGYGGGYYDRFLATCKKGVLAVGLSLFGPVQQIRDTGEFDYPLDYAVSPEMIYTF